MVDDSLIERAILDLVTQRGSEKTVCPSEVARSLGGPRPEDWRLLMAPVKRVAIRLAKTSKVEIRRKGRPIDDLDDLKGIYRVATPRDSMAPTAALDEGAPAPTSPAPARRRS